jgi:hypothetical protein
MPLKGRCPVCHHRARDDGAWGATSIPVKIIIGMPQDVNDDWEVSPSGKEVRP